MTSKDTCPDSVRTDPDSLRQRYAEAARTVDILITHEACHTAQNGGAVVLSSSEAAEVADAIVAIRDHEMEQLRADSQKWADLAVGAERTRRLHEHDADQYEEQLRQRLAVVEAERDAVYRERAHLVAYLAALHPSHIGNTDPDAPDWAVVIVEAPGGQLSWHIAERDLDLFEHVMPTNRICRGWDGHTTDEKYERIRTLTAAAAPASAAVPASHARQEDQR
ncbi:hypothetical protein ABZ419_11350 [Streptomyces cinnamoneus]|uniref:WDGH domain-containing protein n=1 Tax=Streptomyces cinnamoneus TaxID=53446 RepID=UPI0034105E10